jgi:hypothetical protein
VHDVPFDVHGLEQVGCDDLDPAHGGFGVVEFGQETENFHDMFNRRGVVLGPKTGEHQAQGNDSFYLFVRRRGEVVKREFEARHIGIVCQSRKVDQINES